jgi:hypothetical protein
MLNLRRIEPRLLGNRLTNTPAFAATDDPNRAPQELQKFMPALAGVPHEVQKRGLA